MMTVNLERQRCAHHADREAVARCPQCERFFCRECIAEHEGRVLCALCLSVSHDRQGGRRTYVHRLLPPLQFALGLIVLWGCFYYLGQTLMVLPDQFHEGTMWQTGAWGDP